MIPFLAGLLAGVAICIGMVAVVVVVLAVVTAPGRRRAELDRASEQAVDLNPPPPRKLTPEERAALAEIEWYWDADA